MRVWATITCLLLTFTCSAQVHGEDSLTSFTGYQHSPDLVIRDSSRFSAPRNAIYGEYNVLYTYATYERLFRIRRSIHAAAGAGLGFGMTVGGYGEYPLIYYFKPSLLIGGPIHQLEFGTFITPKRRSWGMFTPHMGYRFTNPNGFTFRVGAVVIMQFEREAVYPEGYDEWVDVFPLPGISFGKTF